ncbi:hypothetical protein QJS10_CPA07g00691 [Acorus calamus]|uniref:Uncharacterized protein n=1 Tax=Acorus calamus TaxID=4465 RepID=A0AAV9EET1_ACOCL|nr:hypothetical protein QJS10_CPA07g00691 [Acorus calamus]
MEQPTKDPHDNPQPVGDYQPSGTNEEIPASVKGEPPSGTAKAPKKEKPHRKITLPLSDGSDTLLGEETTLSSTPHNRIALANSYVRIIFSISPLKLALVFFGIPVV